MTPVWTQVYDDAIKPYSDNEIGLDEAWERGTQPVRRFMAEQIRRTDNDDDVYLFLKYLPSERDPETGELPTTTSTSTPSPTSETCRCWRCCRRSCSAS